MTNYEELIARLESRIELGLTLNKEAATAIQQLVAERDSHAKQCCKLAEEVIELEDVVDEHEHRITNLTAECDAALAQRSEAMAIAEAFQKVICQADEQITTLKAENESLRKDAEQWRAYQKRKQDLIDRGFLRNPLRAEAEDTDGGSRAGHECPVCRQCDCVGCGDAAMAQGEKG